MATHDYQLHARKCLRWADGTDNEENQQAFLGMAMVWTTLDMQRDAKQARRRDSRSVDPRNDGTACGREPCGFQLRYLQF